MILKKAQDVNGQRTYLNSTNGQVYLLYFLVENTDKFFGGVSTCTLGHASIKSLGQATKQYWDARQYLWEFLTLRLWVDLTLASLGVRQYLWEFLTFETLGRPCGMQNQIMYFKDNQEYY
ncbi:unnamed protein product [Rhizophagus irregularis]|uniref:Uncharacterized protein n=1 Tax=Rhizophagus irregularis TaxID=588596 RepID=A0A915ZWL9_9GLOM|nr:unnamed protein product [Rhizophagus irregularis]CAB5217142.1 unnamed protein product [Rhizophagus irregularis]CAB5391436.1 unnamed protein product [Rhizophagus irregularis]